MKTRLTHFFIICIQLFLIACGSSQRTLEYHEKLFKEERPKKIVSIGFLPVDQFPEFFETNHVIDPDMITWWNKDNNSKLIDYLSNSRPNHQFFAIEEMNKKLSNPSIYDSLIFYVYKAKYRPMGLTISLRASSGYVRRKLDYYINLYCKDIGVDGVLLGFAQLEKVFGKSFGIAGGNHHKVQLLSSICLISRSGHMLWQYSQRFVTELYTMYDLGAKQYEDWNFRTGSGYLLANCMLRELPPTFPDANNVSTEAAELEELPIIIYNLTSLLVGLNNDSKIIIRNSNNDEIVFISEDENDEHEWDLISQETSKIIGDGIYILEIIDTQEKYKFKLSFEQFIDYE